MKEYTQSQCVNSSSEEIIAIDPDNDDFLENTTKYEEQRIQLRNPDKCDGPTFISRTKVVKWPKILVFTVPTNPGTQVQHLPTH